jgi:DNA-binding XRE family transcriptional regulator
MTDSQIIRKLVAKRKELNMSQAEAAKQIGITRLGLRYIEQENGSPLLCNIIKYMEVVGIKFRMYNK